MHILPLLMALLAPGFASEPSGSDTAASSTPALGTAAFLGYDAVRIALVGDDLAGARAAAGALAVSPDDPGLAAAASAVAAAPDLPTQRAAFSELSRVVVIRLASTPSQPKIVVYHCGMWAGYSWWIQPTSGIANPYMGAAMPKCGEEKSLKAALKATMPTAK